TRCSCSSTLISTPSCTHSHTRRSPASPHPPFSPLVPLRQPTPTLFPYTTLFRSRPPAHRHRGRLLRHRHRRGGRRDLRERLLPRSEEHTSELQSRFELVCRLLLEKKNRELHKK